MVRCTTDDPVVSSYVVDSI